MNIFLVKFSIFRTEKNLYTCILHGHIFVMSCCILMSGVQSYLSKSINRSVGNIDHRLIVGISLNKVIVREV